MEELPTRIVPLRGGEMSVLHDHISHCNDEKAVETAKECLSKRKLISEKQDGIFTDPVITRYTDRPEVCVKAITNGKAVKVIFTVQEAPVEIKLERAVLEIAGEFLFTMRPIACIQTLVEGLRRVGKKIPDPKDYYGLRMRPIHTAGEEDLMVTADVVMDGVEYHFKPGGVVMTKHRRGKKKKRPPAAFKSRVTRKRGW